MKILVTGGAGFIGSHLVQRLVDNGHDVVVIDNEIRGNKIPIGILSQIEYILGDVRNETLVDQAIKDVDIIFHFAAVLGVDVVADLPVETMDVEVIGTRNIINAARKYKIKKVFYASTSGIYSHSAIVQTALSEEVVVDPRTSYAMAKRYNEIYLASHHEETGIDCIALRFFNIYGERQDNRMVIPRFFEQAYAGEDLTVFGNGLQTRDFTYVEDAIDACVALMQVSGFHIVNIANEKEWTVNALAEKVIKITNTLSKIVYIDAPKKRYDYEVERRIGSAAKLYHLTGFKPNTELDFGLMQIKKHQQIEVYGQRNF